MKTATMLVEMESAEIKALFAKLQQQISEIQTNFQPKQPNEYLTRAEVSEMLKVDLSTLHNWVKKGKLIPHCIGNRVYFLRAEVEAALIPIKKKGMSHG